MSLDSKGPCEHRQNVVANLDIFRLRVSDCTGFERPARPGELKRNQKFVFRLIAIHVESRQDVNVQCFRHIARAALRGNLSGGINGQFILLGVRKERQEQAAKSEEQRWSA